MSEENRYKEKVINYTFEENLDDLKNLTDYDVKLMIEGKKSNNLLRNGLCGKNLERIDLSNLSIEMFKKLSFDSNTIFSDEQLEKFHPFELLEKSKLFTNSIKKVHLEGKNGDGIKIAVIDSNIQKNHIHIKDSNVNFVEDSLSGEEEVHGLTVLSALLEVAPNLDVTYYADNKYNKQSDERKEEYIQDIIGKGDIKIISMSSSFRNKKIEDIAYKSLEENEITLIDSNTFYDNFTYCFKNNYLDGSESFEEAFCEVEQNYKDYEYKKAKLKKLIYEFNIKGESLKEKLELLKLKYKEKNQYDIIKEIEDNEEELLSEEYDGENGILLLKKNRLIESEKKERKENRSVEIPCGGRTFATQNNTYKYFGTCSASYTIPQVAALFAIARQINPNIKYDEFVDKCRETAIKINDRNIISPDKLISEIELNIEPKEMNNFKNDLKEMVVSKLETSENKNQSEETSHNLEIQDNKYIK